MSSVPEVPLDRGTPREPPSRLVTMPRIVTGLVATIVAAHLARILAPLPLQAEVFARFALLPAVLPFEGAVGWLQRGLGHAWLHGGYGPGSLLFGFMHLFFNVMLLLQTGESVARRFGRSLSGAVRFLALFAVCALGGAAFYVGFNPNSEVAAVGASGAACGLFAAYLLAAHPNWRVAIASPQVRQAGFWFIAVNVGLAWLARSSGVLPIAWEAHLGGFVAGAVAYPLLAPKWRPRTPWD